jgi:hypothetical protein
MVRELAADLAGRTSAELVPEFTLSFPVRAIARILGMPDEFLPDFQRRVLDIFSYQSDPEKALTASRELDAYIRRVIDEKRSKPDQGVIADLVTAEIQGERLTGDQIVGFIKVLFPAGGETTVRAIGNSSGVSWSTRSSWPRCRRTARCCRLPLRSRCDGSRWSPASRPGSPRPTSTSDPSTPRTWPSRAARISASVCTWRGWR